tara:strand:- start:1182 stop:2018 length:837 start_codon:yes stop_codon:yes gene_type:complete
MEHKKTNWDKCDLNVYPVLEDPDRPKYRETHPNLLSPPFRIAVVGASKSGKSNYIMQYFRPEYYGEGKNCKCCFDKIFVFSPNLGLDSTTRHIKDIAGEENIFQSYSDNMLDAIIQYQKDKGDDREKILILADDLIALGCSPTARIFTASTYLRHLDCSIAYLTQTYTGHYSLPPVLKNNLEGLVMFKNPSAKQVKSLTEDLQGTFGDDKNIRALLDHATLKPYNFCYFDYRNLKVYHNHTELLWEKFDENGNYNPPFQSSLKSNENKNISSNNIDNE